MSTVLPPELSLLIAFDNVDLQNLAYALYRLIAATPQGDVVGPGSAVNNDIVTFNLATGKLIKDSGVLITTVVIGPASAVSGNLPSFSGTGGKLLQDSLIPAANVVQGPASAINGNLAVFDLTTGKLIKDGGSPSALGGFVQFLQTQLTSGNLTTTSTSPTNVTGAVVTMTTGAHRCIINMIVAGKSTSATEYVFWSLSIDGSVVPSATSKLGFVRGVDGQSNIQFITDVLTAASHTFQLQFFSSSGAATATTYAVTANPCIMQVIETSLTT